MSGPGRGLQVAVFLAVAVLCAGCDQATKVAATEWLQTAGFVDYLGGIVRFQLVHNPGAFMSLGAGFPEWLRTTLLVGVVPLALVVLCVSFLRSEGLTVLGGIALGLVAGGGGGNWFDRLADGTVTDFVRLELAGLRTGIFNVADVAILAGVALLLLVQHRAGQEAQADPDAVVPPAAAD